MKKWSAVRRIVLVLLVALAGCGLLLYGNAVALGVRRSLGIVAAILIPSLFPFMALSSFLVRSGLTGPLSRPLRPLCRFLGLPPGAGAVLLTTLIGGYPVAAAMIGQMVRAEVLDERSASRMLLFCVNAGPAFLIATVGTAMMGDVRLGLMLYAAGTVSSLFLALITRPRRRGNARLAPELSPAGKAEPVSRALVGAVSDASGGMLQVAGFVLLFGAITAMFQASGLLNWLANQLAGVLSGTGLTPSFFSALLIGFLEVTAGCHTSLGTAGLPRVLLMAGLCGFGGLSVHCQVAAGVSNPPVRMRGFFLSRLIHAGLNIVWMVVLLWLFPVMLPVFSAAAAPLPIALSANLPASLSMLALGLMAVLIPRWRGTEH